MGMTKEQLIAKGFTEAQADVILEMHSETLKGNYIPKHRFDEVNGELAETKKQITARDKQIEDLKKFEGDAVSLQTKLAELEKTNKLAKEEYEKQITAERKRTAVKMALISDKEGKPHDADMVLGLINLDSIQVDENGAIVSGLKEQHANLRKEKAFLFETAQTQTTAKPAGWKVKGDLPTEGDKNTTKPDESVSFGKSLAQQRLGMLGVTQNTTNNE